ncbi:MAG: hypothetical protein MJA31_08680, partial [Clostridia bacterium]|nr:hypothetical protein [Clostridia bacterium]
MEQKIEQLLEELDKEEAGLVNKKNLLEGMNIEYLLVGAALLLGLSNNEKSIPFSLKLDQDDPEDAYDKIARINHLVKDIMPYFGSNMRNMFTGIESLLNI